MTKERLLELLSMRGVVNTNNKIEEAWVFVIETDHACGMPYLITNTAFTQKEWERIHSGISVPIDWDVLGNEIVWVHLWDAKELEMRLGRIKL